MEIGQRMRGANIITGMQFLAPQRRYVTILLNPSKSPLGVLWCSTQHYLLQLFLFWVMIKVSALSLLLVSFLFCEFMDLLVYFVLVCKDSTNPCSFVIIFFLSFFFYINNSHLYQRRISFSFSFFLEVPCYIYISSIWLFPWWDENHPRNLLNKLAFLLNKLALHGILEVIIIYQFPSLFVSIFFFQTHCQMWSYSRICMYLVEWAFFIWW